MKDVFGLTQQQADSLLKEYGENKITVKKTTSITRLLLGQYTNLITGILLLGGIFSFLISDKLDAAFIFLVLIVNGLFGFIQEYRAERTLEKLAEFIVPRVSVIRDRAEQEISACQLVPGDSVILREGERIPADGRLIESTGLEIDEAVFTGESLPVAKRVNDEALSGTLIIQGKGILNVQKTGMSTRLGMIAQEIQQADKPKTPLMATLDHLGKTLALCACILALSILPVGFFQGRALKDVILTTVSIAVAMIPEGLPLVVTIALAFGAYKMANRRAIVRKMAAIETLGSTNVILTDKTGTLTENDMRVKSHWVAGKGLLPLFLRSMVTGNTAYIALSDSGSAEIVGDKTDGALLLFVKKHSAFLDTYRQEGKVISEKPFDPATKSIETTWKDSDTEYTFIRGAPESILEKVRQEDQQAEKKLNEFAHEALRVIAFAYKTKRETSFHLLGLVGIYDPPRPEACDALEKAKKAGIRVVMVTGDNPLTARAIAQEINLIENDELVVIFDEVKSLSDEELTQKLPKIRVFARMKPEDKLRLVNLYKKMNCIVAVTGDGVNDALALSESNIGVAMGRGTDVAKEAADIVITDDNLATLVKAIEEGRGIFDNIMKSVVFLISSNLTEFLVIFLGIVVGLPIPLTTTQVLWINLVSDGLPSIALATDSKRANLLLQKPRNVAEGILNRKRITHIASITIPFSLGLVLFYYYLIHTGMVEHTAQFILFNTLIVGEMGIIFLVRGGIRPVNKFLFLSIGITLLLQWIISVTPALRLLFS